MTYSTKELVDSWMEWDAVRALYFDNTLLPPHSQNESTRAEIQRLWDEGNTEELEKRLRYDFISRIHQSSNRHC
jgi:hypothetical protein